MIKSTKKESPAPDTAKRRQPVCWSQEAHAQSLRVELNDEKFFVFPYIHFMFAKLECSKEGDVLTMSFATHDIRIAGKNLREVGVAAQKLSVDWVREATVRYAALMPVDAV